jgi:uncharacterized protein (TIGR02996 family)
MTHADAFLQDILANPEDDGPRLIFADWLEEHGGPAGAARGEFIRVQCALAAGLPPGSRRAQLEERQQHLQECHDADWARPVRRLVRGWAFRRGFVEEVSSPPRAFLSGASKLFRRAPVQHVKLSEHGVGCKPALAIPELGECVYLRRVLSLDLSGNGLDSTGVKALVVSPNLTRLAVLELADNRIGDGGVRALAASPLLGRLTHLNLAGNELGPDSVRVLAAAVEDLARAGQAPRLRKLDLAGNKLGAAGRRALAASPALRRVARF